MSLSLSLCATFAINSSLLEEDSGLARATLGGVCSWIVETAMAKELRLALQTNNDTDYRYKPISYRYMYTDRKEYWHETDNYTCTKLISN